MRCSAMRAPLPIIAAALTLGMAGCERQSVNPPTEPAQPVTGSGTYVGEAPASAGPATGPASFVGRWAANVAWCARPAGDQAPIVITPTRFDGYENRCEVVSVVEVDDSYVADLSCQAEGQAVREQVRMAVTDDILNLSYLDRDGAAVQLYRCPGSLKAEGQAGLSGLLKSE